jgi:hypothetical protein
MPARLPIDLRLVVSEAANPAFRIGEVVDVRASRIRPFPFWKGRQSEVSELTNAELVQLRTRVIAPRSPFPPSSVTFIAGVHQGGDEYRSADGQYEQLPALAAELRPRVPAA